MHVNDSLDTPDKDFERLVKQEELILDVTNKLTQALEHTGVTKSELAKRIERTPGFVSQVFGGGRNLTLRTISDIAAALSLRPALQLSPDRKSKFEIESFDLESGWQHHFQWRVPSPRQKIELTTSFQSTVDRVIQVA